MFVAFRSLIHTSVAVAVALILSAGAVLAQTVVDCTSVPGALVTFFSGTVTPGTTVQVEGNCTGEVFINNTTITIEQAGGGGTIEGGLFITGSSVYLVSITLDGTGADNRGITMGGPSPGYAPAFASTVSLDDVTIENYPDSGIGGFAPGGSVVISGGAITGNENCGISIYTVANIQVSGTTISGNGTDPSDTSPGDQCGIHVEGGGSVTLSEATIEGNNGPALWISQGTVTDTGSALSSPGTVTLPAIVVRRGSFDVSDDMIIGTGHSNAIFATPGATITMQGTTVTQSDASDATALIADGSTLLSLGGNTIANGASGGIAIAVSNASTFRERNEASFMIPLAADSITGAGSAQIESNIELGTGATPSSWTGAISVAQNSSLRMDGGITLTGTVSLTQASNGFFNTALGGQNIVTGGVSCPFTTNAGSHVAGNAKVLLSSGGASAVTIGVTSPDCLAF
jgi:hypothetical protein